jgi:putative ABC transport system permease protein
LRPPLPNGRLTMAGPSISMARSRITSLIAVACAVFGGAAMVTATAVLGETGLSSHLEPDRLAEAEILVVAPQRQVVVEDVDIPFPERQTLPADLVAEIEAVSGVAAAAADVTFTARFDGATGGEAAESDALVGAQIEGHSWDTAALFDTETGAPGTGEVVFDTETAAEAGLAVGDHVALTSATGTAEYTVSAIADTAGQGFYTDATTAAALAGHQAGQADLIAIDLDDAAANAIAAADLNPDSAHAAEHGAITTADAIGAAAADQSVDAAIEAATVGPPGNLAASATTADAVVDPTAAVTGPATTESVFAAIAVDRTADATATGAFTFGPPANAAHSTPTADTTDPGSTKAETAAIAADPNAADELAVNTSATRAAADHAVDATTITGATATEAAADQAAESTTAAEYTAVTTADATETTATAPDPAIHATAGSTVSEDTIEAVADDLRSALSGTGFEVVTGDALGDAEALAGTSARSELVQLSMALAATIVLLVGFITAGAIGVSVAGQRRDLALLRAVGATPRQVRRLVAAQASIVAAIGLVPGIAVGYLLAERFTGFLAGSAAMPQDLPVAYTPISGLIAAALLLATVQIAARAASLRTSRLPATAAVAESRIEPREPGRIRTGIGLLVLAMAIAQALTPLVVPGEAAFASAATATLTAVIGLALAGPALVRTVLRLRARKSGADPDAPAWLAASNGHAYARRTAGAVAVLALAVGLTVTQVSAQSTFTQTAAAETADGARADATVIGPISTEDLAALNGANGVEAAVGVIQTTVLRTYDLAGDVEAEPLPALAFSPGIDQVADLDLEDGDLADLTGDTVALDSATARIWGAGVGDQVTLILADGTRVDAEVAATYGRGFGFGSIVLAADLVTGHAGARFYDAALTTGDAAAVTDWAAGVPGLTVETGATVPYTATGMTPDQWLNVMVTLVLCGYVMLGAANGLVAATARRRGEFASLRAAGATPRQVRAMIRRETLFLCTLAIGAGLAVSVLPMTLLSLVFLGEPWPQGPLWVIPAVVALTALVAGTAIAIPTRKALKVPLTKLVAAAE